MDMTEILMFAFKNGASDIHISSGMPPMLRVHGDMMPIKVDPLDGDTVRKMIYDIMNDEQRKVFEERRDLDFALELKNTGRFRVNVYQQMRGMGATFRTIPTEILDFETLNLPPQLKEIANYKKGLVLVTGPTGSGKSTTLAALIDLINKTRQGHILTVEDPVEFVHTPKQCLITQREVGPHTHSFANALRGALRQDPDIILIGEMRDLETVSLALTAAETGHLVMGTLHTSGAAKTIDRIVDVFPSEEQQQIRSMFAESVQAIVSQSLLKKKDGSGKVAALEIMFATHAIRNLIRENKVAQLQSTIQTSLGKGMQTMDHSLKQLVQQGVVSQEEAFKYASNKDLFRAS